MDNKGYPNFHFLKRQNSYLKLNLEKRGTKNANPNFFKKKVVYD